MVIIDFLLNCDKYIDFFITSYGLFVYIILFAIIFCETGLVFLPFLPGDSLIFAAGAFAGMGRLNIYVLFVIMLVAAIVGDSVNYEIGKHLGQKILGYKKIRLIKDEHLHKANAFIAKYGAKAVLMARFAPIVRTVVPFVVGIGKLEYKKFIKANALGGFLWVTIFLVLGYFFGNISFVKNNFSAVILAIIFLSILPMITEFLRAKFVKPKTNEE